MVSPTKTWPALDPLLTDAAKHWTGLGSISRQPHREPISEQAVALPIHLQICEGVSAPFFCTTPMWWTDVELYFNLVVLSLDGQSGPQPAHL